jgi:hypothetical protein
VKYDCLACHKQVTATKNNRYRTHTDGTGDRCENSSTEIPEHLLAQPVGKDDAPDVPREGVDYAVCPQCDRKVKLTRLGYFEPHPTTLKGGDTCLTTGVRAKHARKTETVPLPGDEPKGPEAARPEVSAQQEITSPAPTSESAPAASSPPEPPQTSGAAASDAPAEVPTAAEPSTSDGALEAVTELATTGTLSPESTPTSGPSDSLSTPTAGSTSSDAPGSGKGSASAGADLQGPFRVGPAVGGPFQQPFSPFFQPGPIPVSVKTVEAMNERGREIATRLREIFYSYVNRNARDNRSAQTTLGPSEIGSPCDRQLAMKLMGVPAVNPQESWAPFVGTAVHAELAAMFEWANGANSGRFAVEMPLTFGSSVVPRGTGDLLDRVLFMFLDHKLMGKYSLKKLIEQGPSDEYRVQLHTYAYGAEKAGEKVKEIALVGWPREESSLQNLYVHVEPYDRQIALDAIARVERLHREVQGRLGKVPTNVFVSENPLEVAQTFGTGDACRWCPFHNKADKRFTRGCPGK